MPLVKISDPWLRKTAAHAQAALAEGARERYWDEDVPGFGVVVGRTAITFIARHRVRAETGPKAGELVRRDVTIARYGAPHEDGGEWTEPRARKRARALLGKMIDGHDPVAARPGGSGGPTLRDAFDAHVAKLEKLAKAGKRSQATIDTLIKSQRYVEDWLDRPIANLTGDAIADIAERIKREARPRANARNERGAALANRVITNIATVWNTLNRKLAGKLGTWNPAASVDRDALVPKRQRVDDLADWYARVQTMRSPIQRDGLVLALFTGLRHEDVRTARFEHSDLDERTLTLPDPKGGPAATFMIPLPQTCVDIIERRKRENATVLGAKDGGWIFPAIDVDGDVGPISDLRQQVHEVVGEDDDGDAITRHTRFPSEDVHALRRTYESVAQEEGVSELDQHVLTNHSFGSRTVNQTYIAQHIDHLAACAEKIERGLWARIKSPAKRAAKRGKLGS